MNAGRLPLISILALAAALLAGANASAQIPESSDSPRGPIFDSNTVARAVGGMAAEAARSPQGDWARVVALTPGTEVTVSMNRDPAVSGTLVSAGSDGLTLRTAGGDRLFDRAGVVQVTRTHRSRGSKLGAVIGAGAGAFAGVVAALNLGLKDCGGDCSDEKTMMGVSLAGMPLAGGLLGYYAFPGRPRQDTVYRRD